MSREVFPIIVAERFELGAKIPVESITWGAIKSLY
jgi:hypothetical protein